MVTSKITAILAVMCLALAGVGVVVADNDIVAEDEPKYIIVTYDGVILPDVATALFAEGAAITYETSINKDVEVGLENMALYEAIKTKIVDKKIVLNGADYKDETIQKAVKEFGMGDTKTVVKLVSTVDATLPFFAEKTVKDLQTKVAEKDATIAEKDKVIAEKDKVIAEKDAALEKTVADKDKVIAEKDASIKTLTEEKDALDAEKKVLTDEKADLQTKLDAANADLKKANDKIAEYEKEQPKVPFYETTMGQVAIILIVFVVGLLVYYNFDAIKTKLVSLKGGKP